MTIPALEVKPYRGKFAVFAGKSRLSRLVATAELAERELEGNREFYRYWSGSAGVSCENTEAKVVKL